MLKSELFCLEGVDWRKILYTSTSLDEVMSHSVACVVRFHYQWLYSLVHIYLRHKEKVVV